MLQQTKDAIKVSFEKVKAHQLAITTIVNHIKKQVGKDMPEIKQLVDYPRCRIYREFVQSLIADRM